MFKIKPKLQNNFKALFVHSSRKLDAQNFRFSWLQIWKCHLILTQFPTVHLLRTLEDGDSTSLLVNQNLKPPPNFDNDQLIHSGKKSFENIAWSRLLWEKILSSLVKINESKNYARCNEIQECQKTMKCPFNLSANWVFMSYSNSYCSLVPNKRVDRKNYKNQ